MLSYVHCLSLCIRGQPMHTTTTLQVYLPLLPEHPGFVSCPTCMHAAHERPQDYPVTRTTLHALAYSTSWHADAGTRQWIDRSRRLLPTQLQAAQRHGKVTCRCRQAAGSPSRRRRPVASIARAARARLGPGGQGQAELVLQAKQSKAR